MLGIDDGLFRFLVHGSRLAGRPSNIREPRIPDDAELEPSAGVPHRLGGASEGGDVGSARPALVGSAHRRPQTRTSGSQHRGTRE
jgi:hypothetical protein